MDKDNSSDHPSQESSYLLGKLLLAMPSMNDERFHRSVIFICAHDAHGAMGLVVNHPMDGVVFKDLLKQLDIESDILLNLAALDLPIMRGGPVDGGRGFLLHGSDFAQKETIKLGDDFGVTGTIEAIKAIAQGDGPEELLFILGYAGWSAGQLEQELQHNSWLVADPDPALIFGKDKDDQWSAAVSSLGFDPAMLSVDAGRA